MNTDTLMRFVGNPSAYALQREDGGYKPVRKPITGSLLKQHLAGAVSVGTYVNVGDRARFVCFDVDTGDDAKEQADSVFAACLELGVPEWSVGMEFSGRKGYHVWVPLQDFREAAELRRFGRAVLALAEVKCEVFPKQDSVTDLGNLVKLPGGKHRVSGMASEWLGEVPKPCPLARWESRVVPQLPEEVAGRRFSGGYTERFPCMDIIQAEGGQEGSRNIQLFHLATMLRRAGVSSDNVVTIINATNEKAAPLDPYELELILQSAETSGPVCSQLPEERQCGDLCIMERTKGLYARPRQLRHAAEGERVVVTLSRREGKTFELEHDDAQVIKGQLT